MPGHAGSDWLNALSLCLGRAGRLDALADLYSADPLVAPGTYRARYPEIAPCLDNPATEAQLAAEWALLKRLGTQVTPSLYTPQ